MLQVNNIRDFFRSKTFQDYVIDNNIDLSDYMLAYYATEVANQKLTLSLLEEIRRKTEDTHLKVQIDEYLTKPDRHIFEHSDGKFWGIPDNAYLNPFKKGDIVQGVWEDNNDYGVIEELCKGVFMTVGYNGIAGPAGEDCVVNVSFMSRESGEIYLNHVPLLQLEKVVLPKEWNDRTTYERAITAMQDLSIGKGYLAQVGYYAYAYREILQDEKDKKHFFKRTSKKLHEWFINFRQNLAAEIRP